MNVSRDGQVDLSIVKSVEQTGGVELEPGDVLFNNTNSPELVGKTALVSSKEAGYAFSNHMTQVRLASGVNSAFVARQLHFLWMTGYMKSRCTNHVNQASISTGTLGSSVPLLVPPAAEQTRIVGKLEELLSDLDAGVAELKAAQAKLQHYRQSLLKAAVEGSLTRAWREAHPAPEETGADLLARILVERRARWEAQQLAKFEAQGKTPPKGWQRKYPEPEQPSMAGMPTLPDGWAWASLNQLLESLRSGSAETSGREPTAFPVLKSSAVRQGHIDLAALNYLNEQQSRPENLLADGDLLITRLSGSVEYVGCAAVARLPATLRVQYPDRIFCGKLLPSTSEMAEFLVLCLGSIHARARLEAAAKSTAGHKRISLSDLLPFPIPLPPRSEIAALSREMAIAQARSAEIGNAIERALRQSTAQRQNLLRAAFAGQLVPQDPADEPAAALLARIRAERAAAQPAAKRSRSTKKVAA